MKEKKKNWHKQFFFSKLCTNQFEEISKCVFSFYKLFDFKKKDKLPNLIEFVEIEKQRHDHLEVGIKLLDLMTPFVEDHGRCNKIHIFTLNFDKK